MILFPILESLLSAYSAFFLRLALGTIAVCVVSILLPFLALGWDLIQVHRQKSRDIMQMNREQFMEFLDEQVKESEARRDELVKD